MADNVVFKNMGTDGRFNHLADKSKALAKPKDVKKSLLVFNDKEKTMTTGIIFCINFE